jgi:exodeoxyribonuclease III
MPFTIATWNINSVRLRADLVARFLREEAPDILCLQECKSPVEKIPLQGFAALGYGHAVARGQKGYNGVAILSRLPLQDGGHIDWCGRGDARHVAARLENGVTIHNFYVPAGGDVPDREANEKFGHKLDFLTEMRDLPRRPARARHPGGRSEHRPARG